jgi:autotransporter-associated beta strand protein
MTFANQFLIGSTPDLGDGGVPFNGSIDEVSLFNRALSLVEVTNLMANHSVDALGSVTGSLPAGSPVGVASAATLDLSGTAQTVAALADVSGSGGWVTNSGNATVTLIINGAATNIFSGVISDVPAGAINLVKNGAGMQTLNGANSYSGNTTVSGGTLAFGQATLGTNTTVTVAGGAVLSLNFVGTNQVGGLVLNGVSQSPGVYNAGDSAPYIAGAGSLVIPNPVATNPPSMTFSNSGSAIFISWPADHTGWRLQMQTNSAVLGLGTNWVDVPGTTGTNQTVMPIGPANGSVFFRLVYP